MAFKKNDDVVREEIVFNGKTYRRYPNARQSAHRKYFSCSGSSLHRDVWIYYRGEIPNDHHIHHIDGNTANNDIFNLECISGEDHYKMHAEERSENGKRPEQLQLLERIRHKTVDWHRSEEGKAWHRENAKTSLAKARAVNWRENLPLLTKNCEVCGVSFATKNQRKTLCGAACQTKKSRVKKSGDLAIQTDSRDNKNNCA